MAIISCPECNSEISDQAAQCPRCGYPLQVVGRSFSGPPVDCSRCGGNLKKGMLRDSQGSGCIVVILGAVLTPLIIGIPIMLYGLHLMAKREGFWQCKSCGEKFPRAKKWYE